MFFANSYERAIRPNVTIRKIVTVYSFEVLRTRYVKTGYFFDTNTKKLQNCRQLRKITNGHRSKTGADSHKILMSVKETGRMMELNFHDYALKYLRNSTSKL